MSILDIIQKENIAKKEVKDLSICESCGRKMINNTIKTSRGLGGSYNCVCGNQLFF